MEKNQINNLYKAGLAFLIILSLAILVKTIFPWGGKGMLKNKDVENTITLSGHGEVSAVPDIATVYFNIRKEGKTVKEAQDAVALIEKATLDFLKTSNIEDKDIKATNSSFNPKYEYKYDTKVMIPCNEFSCPPYPGKSVISGYEANESITVKVRNIDGVGEIIQGLGNLGVSDLNGPNFAIDDEEGLQAEARKKAIEDAKAKAEVLAKDLGVKLGKIVSFSENGYYPMPMYYGKAEMMATDGGASAPAIIPKGENTITSDVNITYEIR